MKADLELPATVRSCHHIATLVKLHHSYRGLQMGRCKQKSRIPTTSCVEVCAPCADGRWEKGRHIQWEILNFTDVYKGHSYNHP